MFADFLKFCFEADATFLGWCLDFFQISQPHPKIGTTVATIFSYFGFIENQLLYSEPKDVVYAYFVDMYNQYFQLEKLLSLYLFCSFIFLVCLLFFALCLLFIYNPIYSVINLILSYISAAFTLIFWEVQFLAVVFILVYLGAVVVLFLFIVMMLNIKVLSSFQNFKSVPYLLFILACLALCFVVYGGFKSESLQCFFFDYSTSTTAAFATKQYAVSAAIIFLEILKQYTIQENFLIAIMSSDYKFSSNLSHVLYSFFGFELLYGALVLLLAMLGCIAITFLITQRLAQKQLYMNQLLQSSFLWLRG